MWWAAKNELKLRDAFVVCFPLASRPHRAQHAYGQCKSRSLEIRIIAEGIKVRGSQTDLATSARSACLRSAQPRFATKDETACVDARKDRQRQLGICD